MTHACLTRPVILVALCPFPDQPPCWPQAQPLPEYVASHPGAVWLVGPLFAAVTGVAFKEGMCVLLPPALSCRFVTH